MTKNEIATREDYIPVNQVPKLVEKAAVGRRVISVKSDGPAYENEWAILARTILKAASHVMNPKAISICSSVISRVYATEKQQKALLAISKKHAPKVYNKIRLNGDKMDG